MFGEFLLDKEDIFTLNISQDITDNTFFEKNYSFLENNYYTFLYENFEEKSEKLEYKKFTFNEYKKEIKYVNNKYQFKHSNNSFNNKKLLFLIEKVKKKKEIINSDDNTKGINLIKFICNKGITEKLYRKDYYFKHFKAIFGKYLKIKLNDLKNRCFPNYIFNNFSTPNYSFTGNPKEIDNYNFLSWTIKDIIIFKQNKNKKNRQLNIINY